MENQRDTVRVETSPSLQSFSLILLLIPSGEASRNRRQKARAAVHKSRRLWLVGQSARRHRIPVLSLPAGGARDSAAPRQVSPRAPVTGDASVSPCCRRYPVRFEGSAARVRRNARKLGKEVLGSVWATRRGSSRDNGWDFGRGRIGEMDEQSPRRY